MDESRRTAARPEFMDQVGATALRVRCWLRRNPWGPALLLLGGVLLLGGGEAWARAGGGQRWGGGGGGGGRGGGGGGGGGIDLVRILVPLIIEYPAVGIPATILVLGGLGYLSWTGNHRRQGRTIARFQQSQRKRVSAGREERALAGLEQAQPGVDVEALRARVRRDFVAIQQAWSDGDMSPVRHLLSDGVYNRFTTQLAIETRCGLVNKMSRVEVSRVVFVGFQRDAHFETLHVGIEASAVDQTLDRASQRVVEGASSPVRFAEYWSLLRRPGAPQGTEFEAGRAQPCPQCGAPLDVGQSNRCGSCHSLINSGAFGWVLAEITQADVFQPPRAAVARALGESAGSETAPQVLEDKAAAMFWALQDALVTGQAGSVERIAEPSLAQGVRAALAHGGKAWVSGVVGSVDLLGARRGEEGPEVQLQLRFQGRPAREEGGRLQGYGPMRRAGVRLWLRRSGAEPEHSQQAGLASLGCGNCAGPLDRSDQGACPWCGTPLRPQPGSWVLVGCALPGLSLGTQPDLITRAAPGHTGRGAGVPRAAARSMNPRSANPRSTMLAADRLALFACLVELAAADGVAPEEERALERLGENWRIDERQRARLLERARRGEPLSYELPSDRTRGRQWLAALARLALADGRVSRQEQGLMERLAASLGLTQQVVRVVLRKERQALYREARQG